MLRVSYLDLSGNLRSYEGSETGFDWDLVAEVIDSDRSQDTTADPTPHGDPDQPPLATRIEVADILSSGETQWQMTEALIPLSPLSADELAAAESVLNPAYFDDLMAAQ